MALMILLTTTKNQVNLPMEIESSRYEMDFSRPDEDTLLVRLAGNWRLEGGLPTGDAMKKQLELAPPVRRVILDGRQVKDWDTVLLAFLTKMMVYCSRKNIQVEKKLLPQGVQRLLALASAVPEQKDTGKVGGRASFLIRVGERGISFVQSANEMLGFIGEAVVAFCKLLVGKARFRRSDFFLILQQCGADALPIVSLISLLVGLILAFVGAVQLMMFGAQIYVANLVAIAMVRVMGAMMTGIIMAGRTGAAFAAQLGTMQVNEELDALTTLGISPMAFLVLPRMLALCLMMPLLCLYADFMGILGGLIVGVGMLDLNVVEYYYQTRASVGINTLLIGLFHSAVFGVLVALAGCLRGIQCGRSASAVGQAATSAVVTGIVSIIVATAIITIVCNVLGI
jgi:phospholipid/cholesterol/gamma-HCH transport system permease protein